MVTIYFFAFQTQTMIDEIKKTFKKRVKEHEWIDEKTTKSVVEKANMLFHALQIKSSFPLTVHEYSSYGFRESNYSGSVRRIPLLHCK